MYKLHNHNRLGACVLLDYVNILNNPLEYSKSQFSNLIGYL